MDQAERDRPHNCRQVAKITEMETKVRALDKIVNGNGGSQGLYKNVITLNNTIGVFAENTKRLTTSVSALVKFQNEYESRQKEKEKFQEEINRIKEQYYKDAAEKAKLSSAKIWKLISIAIALLGLVVTLIVALVKIGGEKGEQSLLDHRHPAGTQLTYTQWQTYS